MAHQRTINSIPSDSRAPAYPGTSTECHLSALDLTFNNIPYCVVGSIDFDFRSEVGGASILTKIRLAPLVGPTSQRCATSIDVIFRGRWRTACAFLKKRDVVCISRAQITPAEDVEVHEAQLVLRDPAFENPPVRSPAAASAAANAALFVLSGNGASRRPLFAVDFRNLGVGRIPCTAPETTTKRTVLGGPSLQSPRTLKASRTITQPVGTMDVAVNAAAAAAAAPVSRSRDGGRMYTYKSIENLWDELESNSISGSEEFHVYGVVIEAHAPSTTFGPDLKSDVKLVDESSFKDGSDGMEAKTLFVHRFDRNPRNGIPYRAVGDIIRAHRLRLSRFDQGGRMYAQGGAKAYSTFLLWAGDGEDFTPIEDRGPTHGPGAVSTPSHTMTDYDRGRITALREFSKRYIKSIHNPQRPFLRSVAEVVEADLGERWLTQAFDLLALYTPSTAAAMVDGMNGAVRFSVRDGRRYVHHSIRVESVDSDAHRSRAANYRFVDFVSSFHHRPDVIAAPRWLLIRDAHIRARSTPGAPREVALKVQKHSSTVLWLPDYAPEVRAHLQSDAIEPQAPILSGGPIARPPPRIPAHAVQLPPGVHEEGAAERARIDRDLARRWQTLGTHRGMYLPVRSVRSVMQAALNGSKEAMRVQGRVRGWVAPRDVRFTARPFCEPCREFVAKRVQQCDTCGSRLGWAFLVRFKLADDDGCLADAWLTAEHAEKFFGSKLVPRDLTRDVQGAEYVRNVSVALMKTDIRLDCLVQPYVAEDEHGYPRPVCRIVHTGVTLP